jgi:hypothetical protein
MESLVTEPTSLELSYRGLWSSVVLQALEDILNAVIGFCGRCRILHTFRLVGRMAHAVKADSAASDLAQPELKSAIIPLSSILRKVIDRRASSIHPR